VAGEARVVPFNVMVLPSLEVRTTEPTEALHCVLTIAPTVMLTAAGCVTV